MYIIYLKILYEITFYYKVEGGCRKIGARTESFVETV